MCHAWACLDGMCVWGIENFNNVFCFITGKDDTLPPSGSVTESVVLELAKGLENRGHHLFCDNYYTGVPLFSSLRDLGFGACGTVRVNRRGVPKELTTTKLAKGEVLTAQTEDGTLALKWMDKRPVTLLSTIHDDTMVTKVRRTRLLSYYGFSHRTVKWWRRAFYHLLEVGVVNAYILYTESEQAGGECQNLSSMCDNDNTGRKLDHEQVRVQLAIQLLEEAGTQPPQPQQHPPPITRLTERHFLERVPPRVSGQQAQPECVVCSKQKGKGRKTTTYQCKQCKLAMCVVPCFELYHTKRDPQRYL